MKTAASSSNHHRHGRFEAVTIRRRKKNNEEVMESELKRERERGRTKKNAVLTELKNFVRTFWYYMYELRYKYSEHNRTLKKNTVPFVLTVPIPPK